MLSGTTSSSVLDKIALLLVEEEKLAPKYRFVVIVVVASFLIFTWA
jgi:hypothetical protein